jgi:hypothetical protein
VHKVVECERAWDVTGKAGCRLPDGEAAYSSRTEWQRQRQLGALTRKAKELGMQAVPLAAPV